jgi:hypothetical protein
MNDSSFKLNDVVYFIWCGRICWGTIKEVQTGFGVNIPDNYRSYIIKVGYTYFKIDRDSRDIFRTEEELALQMSMLILKDRKTFPNIAKNCIDNFAKIAKLDKS